jgi:SAM-dependent methyltransferase
VSTDKLRQTFGQDPGLYDRTRPGYPTALFTDLAGLAEIGPASRVAEIGPGTGQATTALLDGGAHVVAVEMASSLAGVLQCKLGRASLEVVVSAFEDWQLPSDPFDTVAFFSSWHWLDPATRTPKTAAALRPGGALVTVTTDHVLGGTEEFFADVQRCYDKWTPSTKATPRAAADVASAVDEVDASEMFWPAVRRRYQQDITYSASDYVDVLATYSDHRTLTRENQQGLFANISELINRTYGGTITKRYLHELRVARRPHLA